MSFLVGADIANVMLRLSEGQRVRVMTPLSTRA